LLLERGDRNDGMLQLPMLDSADTTRLAMGVALGVARSSPSSSSSPRSVSLTLSC